MNLPIVTAIVPVHNHELWCQGALLSLVNQKYPALRLAVIDDGSTDNSWNKCLELCNKVKKLPLSGNGEPIELLGAEIEGYQIILARLSKSYGPSAARNYGIKTGWDGTDLFAFLDSDDEYLPGKIRKSVDKWLEFPQLIGEIYSDYITANIVSGLECREFKPGYTKEHLLRECIINMDSLVAKWAIAKVGEFDPEIRVAEDYDMHLRLSEVSLICHIPEALVKIRVGRHSSTDTVSKEQWEQNYRRVMEKLQQRMSNR